MKKFLLLSVVTVLLLSSSIFDPTTQGNTNVEHFKEESIYFGEVDYLTSWPREAQEYTYTLFDYDLHFRGIKDDEAKFLLSFLKGSYTEKALNKENVKSWFDDYVLNVFNKTIDNPPYEYSIHDTSYKVFNERCIEEFMDPHVNHILVYFAKKVNGIDKAFFLFK